jgi:dipeptidyl aminopeptidase/acylaminoacyl peptidase
MKRSTPLWLRSIPLAVLLAFGGIATAQDTYQTPPPVMANLVNNPGTPGVSFTRDGKSMILLQRSESPTIEDLAQEELRLAGVRFNPANHSPSRSGYTTGMIIKDIASGTEKQVTGVPVNAKITSMTWTTDGNTMAFLNMTDTGNEIWLFDLKAASVKKLTDAVVSNVYGPGINWMPDDKTLMVSLIANKGPRPAKPRAPSGPIVQENLGDVNAVRTFQDMLQNPYDEQLFEHFFTTQPAFVSMEGKITPFGSPAIYANINVSPDGKYMLSTVVNKPYSYLVGVGGFERTVNIHDGQGKFLRKFTDLPSSEKTPTGRGATSAGKRSINWRNDAPATLVWVEALDGGDPRVTVPHRDEVFTLDAPFSGQPKSFAKLELRFGGIMWGRNDLALMNESWAESRVTRTWVVNPAKPAERRVLMERSTQDAYNNPGSPRMTRNAMGNMVLHFTPDGKGIYMSGQGASPQGNRPFLDEMSLATGESKRIWQSQPPFYETLSQMVDEKPAKLIISRESTDLQPNYYIVDVASGNLTQITDFPHPTPEFVNVSKEFIKYKRNDGIDMTGTLYLPEGYDKEKDGPLPMLMWAYPREFRSADEAGQVTGSPYQFTRVSPNSALPYVLAGYAVLDNASMPIVGTDEIEPNDVFIEQLVLNAEAAVNEMVNMGVADRERIAVGGHSYGAFMTAHLLAHTDLFRAGIARSGAYNRSLTPFGFQSEPRTYWDDTDMYVKMSPFTYANKIKEPILMIHGTADNNSGTFPIQSERMYAALKGHGATARLVMLPEESHGYAAKESILHMMWETVTWLDKYVKNAPPRDPELRRIPTTESGGE